METAGEAVLRHASAEEAARPQDEREGHRRSAAGDPEPALELRSDRLEPSATAGGAAQGEQHDVLGEHRELDVQLLGAEREHEVREERTGGDRRDRRGHLPRSEPSPHRRARLRAEHPNQRVGEREDQQGLEEPRRPRRELPDLLPDERPQRLGASVVLAIRDVLEERADQQRVGDQRDAEPDQALLREAGRPLPVERGRRQPPGDQEEQPEAEEPADPERDRHGSGHRGRHLVVGLQIPGPVQPVGDGGVHRDHAGDEQDLQRVEIGEAGAHSSPTRPPRRRFPSC